MPPRPRPPRPKLGGPPGPPVPGPRPRPGAPPRPRPVAGLEPSAGFACLGIIAGFGRGIPPVPPGRGIRPSPGRGRPSGRAPPSRVWPPRPCGRRDCPMPCAEENGLLPGRGAPGRRTVAGVGPGRGPGVGAVLRGPGVGRGVAGFGVPPPASPAAGRACGPGVGAAGRGPGVGPGVGRGVPPARAAGLAAGFGPGVAFGASGRALAAGRARGPGIGAGFGVARGPTWAPAAATGASGVSGRPASAFFAAALGFFFGVAAGLAGAAPSDGFVAAWAFCTFSVTRRTTGNSIVEDAERTNSPISLRVLRSSLLSSPSCLASS